MKDDCTKERIEGTNVKIKKESTDKKKTMS